MSSTTVEPPESEATRERKEFNGRAMMQRFREYCQRNNLSADYVQLELWDEAENGSRIKASFGSHEEVYRDGLRALYQRFIDRWRTSFRLADDVVVHLRDYRTDHTGKHGHVDDNNSEDERAFQLGQLKREFYETLARGMRYGWSTNACAKLFHQAKDEMDSYAARTKPPRKRLLRVQAPRKGGKTAAASA
jgi:hypothetical protein